MTEISFNDRKNGYDKLQVDNYIKKISEAYQEVYREHVSICEKYDSLLENYKKLEEQNQAPPEHDTETETIAITLLDAENLAKKIVANARREEARIMDLAAKNLENAYLVLERAMDAVGLEAQRVFDFKPENDAELKEPPSGQNPKGEGEL
ncbi:MAG: DivIVA domain-containing protein [Oscillospiraceae bacterium]|nr:DivIVA domain-containing protein [Oscillospiraceae bacterium]